MVDCVQPETRDALQGPPVSVNSPDLLTLILAVCWDGQIRVYFQNEALFVLQSHARVCMCVCACVCVHVCRGAADG